MSFSIIQNSYQLGCSHGCPIHYVLDVLRQKCRYVITILLLIHIINLLLLSYY